jgi:peptidoglycan hydrolase-like protein with peptidoglycan-binding domain
MPESATGVETTNVQFDLPVLHPDSPDEFRFRQSVQHVQHMLNDLDRDSGAEVLLNESGQFGPKTKERVGRFQVAAHLNPTPQQKGHVGRGTWIALLQQWLPVDEGD